jgi:hypothetical protein
LEDLLLDLRREWGQVEVLHARPYSPPLVRPSLSAMLADLLRRRPRRTIAEHTGNPHDTEPWEWQRGFYPGSRPGECTGGAEETFDQARADFEAAWKVFLSNRTKADFQARHDQEAWTAEKYRRFDRGERMSHDWRPSAG